MRDAICAIVYNGEIYNTDELLPPLLAAGYTFSTTSDTEVILCAYLHYGKDFVSRLNGIFAFAIWDGGTGELLLYRDRAGTKPFFYSTPGGFTGLWLRAKSALLPPGYLARHR